MSRANGRPLLAAAMAMSMLSVGTAASAVDVSTWDELKTNLNSGNSVTLNSNITADGTQIVVGGSPTMNLSNYIVTGTTFTDSAISVAIDGFTINGGSFTGFNSTSSGSTLNVASGGRVTISGTRFSTNHTSMNGGAIYNTGTIESISDASFQNNSADYRGGAIFSEKDIVIDATSAGDNVTFSGNTQGTGTNLTPNGIYMAGTNPESLISLKLKAANGKKITIGDGIDGANYRIIVNGTSSSSGEVVFDGDVNADAIVLDNGTLTVTAGNTLTGDLTVNGGKFNNQGTLQGTLFTAIDMAISSGTVGGIDNDAAYTFTQAGGDVTGNVINDGTYNMTGGTIAGSITNNGTFNTTNTQLKNIKNDKTLNINYTENYSAGTSDTIEITRSDDTKPGITTIFVDDGKSVFLNIGNAIGIKQQTVYATGSGHLKLAGGKITADVINNMTGDTLSVGNVIDGDFTNTSADAHAIFYTGAAVTGTIINDQTLDIMSSDFKIQTGLVTTNSVGTPDVGTLNIGDGTNAVNVTLTPTTAGSLRQKNVTINPNARLNVAASAFNTGYGTTSIANLVDNGTIVFKGDSAVRQAISGTGDIIIDGAVVSNDLFAAGNIGILSAAERRVLDGDSSITDAASLTVSAENIGSTVENNGGLIVTTGNTLTKTLAYAVSGAGKTTVQTGASGRYVVFDADVQQDGGISVVSGMIYSDAGHIKSNVINDISSGVHLIGGEFASEYSISGTGRTIIESADRYAGSTPVTNRGTINQDNSTQIYGTLNNYGSVGQTLVETGAILNNYAGGTITGNLYNGATTNIYGGSLSGDIINLSAGTLNLYGSDISLANGVNNASGYRSAVGATVIGDATHNAFVTLADNKAIYQNSVTINSGSVLSARVPDMNNTSVGTFTNNGRYIMRGGTDASALTNNLTVLGTGETVIDGNVTSNTSIAGANDDSRISILSADERNALYSVDTYTENSKLTINASNVSAATTNNGSLVLNGGSLNKTVTGTGTTTIQGGSVTNTGSIQQNVLVYDNSLNNTTGSITGTTTVNANATLRQSDAGTLNNVVNNGRFEHTAGSVTGILTNNAETTASAPTLGTYQTGGSVATVNNAGTYSQNAGSVGNVDNTGNYTLGGGSITGSLTQKGDSAASAVFNNNGGTVNFASGSEISKGTFNINSDFTVAGGTVTAGTDAAKVVIESGSTLDITSGTVTLDGGASTHAMSNSRVNWLGDVTLNGGNLILANIADQTRVVGTNYNKTGSLTANTGSLTINTSNVLLGSGDTIADAVILNIAGDIIVDSGSSLVLDAAHDTWSSGSITLLGTGNALLKGIQTDSSKTIHANAGILTLEDTIVGSSTQSSVLNNSGDYIAGATAFTLASGNTLLIQNTTTSGTNIGVTIDGTDTWGGHISQSGGVLTLSGRDDTTDANQSYLLTNGRLVLSNSDLALATALSRTAGGTVEINDGSNLHYNNGSTNNAVITSDSAANALTIGNGTNNTRLTLNAGSSLNANTSISIAANSLLNTDADYISSSSVTNNGTYYVTDGTIVSTITGSGHTDIDTSNIVYNEGSIAQNVNILDGTLETTGTITGILNVSSGTNATVAGGSVTSVNNNGSVDQTSGSVGTAINSAIYDISGGSITTSITNNNPSASLSVRQTSPANPTNVALVTNTFGSVTQTSGSVANAVNADRYAISGGAITGTIQNNADAAVLNILGTASVVTVTNTNGSVAQSGGIVATVNNLDDYDIANGTITTFTNNADIADLNITGTTAGTLIGTLNNTNGSVTQTGGSITTVNNLDKYDILNGAVTTITNNSAIANLNISGTTAGTVIGTVNNTNGTVTQTGGSVSTASNLGEYNISSGSITTSIENNADDAALNISGTANVESVTNTNGTVTQTGGNVSTASNLDNYGISNGAITTITNNSAIANLNITGTTTGTVIGTVNNASGTVTQTGGSVSTASNLGEYNISSGSITTSIENNADDAALNISG
ncbi:MAG: hypothetical protein K6A44_00515, partial [bacterium]|nr:hypothetical protein [bacterium]